MNTLLVPYPADLRITAGIETEYPSSLLWLSPFELRITAEFSGAPFSQVWCDYEFTGTGDGLETAEGRQYQDWSDLECVDGT